MKPKLFSKLGRTVGCTDYIVVGIETSRSKDERSIDYIIERIDRFSIAHYKPCDTGCYKVDDTIEFEGHNVMQCILEHFDLGKNTRIICNNSLVFLGSSDFADLLEHGFYSISTLDEDSEDIGLETKGKHDASMFIASAPPTIVGIDSNLNKNKLVITDIRNYGIRSIASALDLLTDKELSTVWNCAELGYSIDKCETICDILGILWKRYCLVVTKYRLGGIGLTYANQSMRAFRRNHYDGTITRHNSESIATIEERTYIAGRCEALYKGWYNGSCYLIDANSLYPSIGRVFQFPREVAEEFNGCDNNTARDRIAETIGFAHVRIETDSPVYPCRSEGSLLWPIGKFNTYLCGPELEYALKNNHITHIYKLVTYRKGYVLKSFCETMLSIRDYYRKTNDKLAEYYIKQITNGLFGAFGRVGMRWIIDPKAISTSLYGGFTRYESDEKDKVQYRVINGICSKLVRCYWDDNVYPAISAYINSVCRSQLWNYIQRAGNGNVLYCSIDGLILTQRGYDNIRDSVTCDRSAYGKFRVCESDSKCYIASAGRYRIGRKIAYTGYPREEGYQYRGFWNARDERYTIETYGGRHCTAIASVPKCDVRRNELGNDDHSQGDFTSPITLWEPPLNSPSDYRRSWKPHQHFDHWQQ